MAARIDALMEGVFIRDQRERLDRLAEDLSPDFVYVSPSAVADGAEGLSEAFSHYRHDERLHASLRRTSPVEIHHGYLRYSWERIEQGQVAEQGWSFGQLDGEGKILRIVSFEGMVPKPTADERSPD